MLLHKRQRPLSLQRDWRRQVLVYQPSLHRLADLQDSSHTAAAAVVPALPATTLPFHSAATFAARSVPIAGTISTPLALRAAKDERDERLHRYCELERKDNPPMV